MKLVVGFLAYNDSSAKYLADFLASLGEALRFLPADDRRVFAFDNSDQDNTANRQALATFDQENPGFLEYMQSAGNLGFGRAYNVLIRAAKRLQAEYFLVVNPDTILEKDTISELIAALDKDRELASAAPKIRRFDFASKTKTRVIDSCGLVLKSGLRFYDLGQGQPDDKRFDRQAILGPSGAAGLFRLDWLEKVMENGQYFDERFFMYKEDCDLAYRLSLIGGKSILVPTAIMYHDRTAASSGRGLLNKISDRRRKSRQVRSWSFRNQHFMFIKHWTKQTFIGKAAIVCRVVSFAIFSLILEQFILKEYRCIIKYNKVLTNVK